MNDQVFQIIEALRRRPTLYKAVREHLMAHPDTDPEPEPATVFMVEAYYGNQWNWFAGFDQQDVEAIAFARMMEGGAEASVQMNTTRVVPIPDELRDRLRTTRMVHGDGGWSWDRGTKVAEDPPTPVNLPTAAWVLQANEHEFGSRGMGWSIWENEADAAAHRKKNTGPGAPDQYFDYDRPVLHPITSEVATALMAKDAPRRISGKGNNAPGRNTILTKDHLP